MAPDSVRRQSAPQPCDGRVITEIYIRREPPTLLESAPRWARRTLKAVLQHRMTKREAVEPFLLVDVGESCTEFLRVESERLLRAQPYLADATVRAVPDSTDPDSAGGVWLEVETVDEIPLVLGASVRRGALAELEYGNANVNGEGVFAAVGWEQGFAFRDGFSARYTNYHLLGAPNVLSLQLEHSPLGNDHFAAVARPFQSEALRVGWHVGVRDVAGYTSFARPAASDVSLRLERMQADAGGVFRTGRGGRRGLLGGLLTHERIEPDSQGVVITDSGLVLDADTVLLGRYREMRRTRLAAVLGMRMLSFRQVRGFDALVGAQDVAVGAQAAVVAGRGISGGDRDIFLAADVYAGAGTPRRFLGLRLQVEGRDNREAEEWTDVIGSGRLAAYDKPNESRTWIASAEFSGAWRERVPMQLTLGDRRGGLRGYRGSRVAGARLGVLRLERREVVSEVGRWAALGWAGFGEVGRTWAGSAPFGVNSGVRASVGVGLLAAVPRQSRRLLRLDVAVPLVRDPDAKWELRVTTSTPTRGFWREPPRLTQARAGLPSPGVFGWP